MHFSSIDDFLWAAGIFGELLLLAALAFRRSYKVFPAFSAYIVWLLVSDPLLMLVLAKNHNVAGASYYRTYLVFNVIQYTIELIVLFEIASVVLRPAARFLSRRSLLIILTALMMVVIFGAIFLSADASAATMRNPRVFVVVNTAMAILRITLFVLIAGLSQLLGLSWKSHVFQLTSGLAFYAVVTLLVELGQSYLRGGPSYARDFYALDHLRIGGYLCALYFWCYVFAKKEAPRKEFSPQMAKFLVSISGSAKRQRSVLARTRDQ